MIRIDGYPIDIAKTETYSFVSKPTSKAVERGPNVNDDVQTDPLQIIMECMVSNTPTGKISIDQTRKFVGAGQPIPGETVFSLLRDIRDRKKLVTVETSKGTFDNMVLSLSIPVSAADGRGGLHFTVTCQQMNLVDNKTVQVAFNLGVNSSGFIKGLVTIWRKRNPPGGVLNGLSEALFWKTAPSIAKGGTLFHADQKTPLSPAALQNYALDQQAEQAEHQQDLDSDFPSAVRAKNRDRYERAQRTAASPMASGSHLDPAVLGLRDPSVFGTK